MLEIIIGIATLVLGAKFGKYWWWPLAKKAAVAVVKDPKHPINNLRKALEQEVLDRYKKDIDAAVAELEKRQADGEREAREAYERGLEMGEGLDVELVEPDPKPEDFKRVFPDREPPQ